MKKEIYKNEQWIIFEDEKEALEWVCKCFKNRLNTLTKNEIKSLDYYIRANPINTVIRIQQEQYLFDIDKWTDKFKEEYDVFMTLHRLCNSNCINQNMVVFRLCHTKNIKQISKKLILKNSVLDYSTFVSTTILSSAIKNIENHFKEDNIGFGRYEYNCIMKIYLPNGINGYYISHGNDCYGGNEFELILNRHTKIKIIEVKFNPFKKCKYELICEVI